MKTMKIFFAALALLAMASCVKEQPLAPETVEGEGASFTASRTSFTKTQLVDGHKVEWKANNEILVFGKEIGSDKDDKATGSETFDTEPWKSAKWFKTSTGGSSVRFVCSDATFQFDPNNEYIMLHPAGGNYYGLCTDDAKYMRFWLSDQTPTLGSYQEAYGYCAAKASDFTQPVRFKNLLPLLKFTVPASLDGRINKITVTSNNPADDGYVAGNMICDYTGDTPVVKVFSEFKSDYAYKNGSTSVALKFTKKEGDKTVEDQTVGMTKGDYYLAIAPKTYSKGITITVRYTDGTTSTRSSSSSVTLESGVIYEMGNVGAENYDGPGITGLPYMFSLTATNGTSGKNVAKYLSKIVMDSYTTISQDVGYRDCFLYENTGAVLQCRQAGRSESDTQGAAYWCDSKGLDNIPSKSMVSSEAAPGFEAYYKLTVPLRFQMPEKFRVTFGLYPVTGSFINWSLKYSIDDETWYDGGTVTLENQNRIYSITVDSQMTINEVLYLKLMPVGTQKLYNSNSANSWGVETRFWGGVLITDMSEVSVTPKPDGAVYFEAFDKMVGGVDYLMSGQNEWTNRLGFFADVYGTTIGSNSDKDPKAKPEVWNGLTCSTVAMRPGYAQIGRTATNQGYSWNTYNNVIGKMVTPKLAAGNLTLSFKAMMYRCSLIGRADTAPVDNVTADKIVVNVIGGGTFEDGNATKTISGVSYSEFQTQTLTIKNATADTQIEFTSPSDVPSTRWFIDDICVSK